VYVYKYLCGTRTAVQSGILKSKVRDASSTTKSRDGLFAPFD
jgi:hypothetical protein